MVEIPTQQTPETRSGPQGRCNRCPSGNVHAAYLIATRVLDCRLVVCVRIVFPARTLMETKRPLDFPDGVLSSRTNRRPTVIMRNCENVSSTMICRVLLVFLHF